MKALITRLVAKVNGWLFFVRNSAKMKPVKLCAEHLGLLQPAVALGDAALLLAKRHWHAGGLVEPWLAPLAAGCIAEGGSRRQQSMVLKVES